MNTARIPDAADDLLTVQHLHAQFELPRKEMAATKRDIIIWVIGMIAVATVIIIHSIPSATS